VFTARSPLRRTPSTPGLSTAGYVRLPEKFKKRLLTAINAIR
jgi:hypothetical protein